MSNLLYSLNQSISIYCPIYKNTKDAKINKQNILCPQVTQSSEGD